MKQHPFDIAPSFSDFFRKQSVNASKSKTSTERLEKRRAVGETVKVPLMGRKAKK